MMADAKIQDAPAGAEPWDKLLAESSSAYRAFLVYRDLGLTRTLDRAGATVYARAQKGLKKGANGGAQKGRKRGATGTIRKWAADFDWLERAAAWDRHLAREAAAAAVEEERKLARDRVQFRRDALRRAYEFGLAALEQAKLVISFPLITKTITADGGKTVTVVQAVDVDEKYKATKMGVIAFDVALRAIDLDIAADKASAAAAIDTSLAALEEAGLGLAEWVREKQALIGSIPDEPPDDDPNEEE